MRLRVAALAAVAGLAAASFTEALAKITLAQIDQDLVGQSAGESKGALMWRFQEQEPRVIKILEENYNGDTAALLVDVTTEGGGWKMAGTIRLHYHFGYVRWMLLKIETLTFQRQFGEATAMPTRPPAAPRPRGSFEDELLEAAKTGFEESQRVPGHAKWNDDVHLVPTEAAEACVRALSPSGSVPFSGEVYALVRGDGSIRTLLVAPNGSIARCIEQRLTITRVPSPPGGSDMWAKTSFVVRR